MLDVFGDRHCQFLITWILLYQSKDMLSILESWSLTCYLFQQYSLLEHSLLFDILTTFFLVVFLLVFEIVKRIFWKNGKRKPPLGSLVA